MKACDRITYEKSVTSYLIFIAYNPVYEIVGKNIRLRLNIQGEIKFLTLSSIQEGKAYFRLETNRLTIANNLGLFTLYNVTDSFLYDFYSRCCFNKLRCLGFDKFSKRDKLDYINLQKSKMLPRFENKEDHRIKDFIH